MLIGIMSDSHDHRENMAKAVKIFNDLKVDAVYHAGDICSPHLLENILDLRSTFDAVFGNSDVQKTSFLKLNGGRFNFHALTWEWELEGYKFAMAHKPEDLQRLISQGGFACGIHGHTHHSVSHKVEGTFILNPGEVCGHRTGKATVMTLEIPTFRHQLIGLK